MTYGELKTLLAGYLHRSDLTARIPTFVTLAQARLNHDIQHIMMNGKSSIVAIADTADITLPSDFLHMVRLQVPYSSGYRTLEQNTLEQNTTFNEGNSWAKETPRYYAIVNMTLVELAPTPAETVTLTCVYRRKLAAFASDSSTDDVLTAFPNAYVYAAMIEATPFIQSDKRLGLWQSLYDAEMARIEDVSFEAQWSDSPRSISNPAADTP